MTFFLYLYLIYNFFQEIDAYMYVINLNLIFDRNFLLTENHFSLKQRISFA